MKSSSHKGFTLIELLVVISIIGVLATIILSSLGDAREKSNMASIQGSLRSLMNEAELYYLDNNSYNGVCTELAPKLAILEDKGALTSCYTQLGLYGNSWGASASYEGQHFAVSQEGVVQFDESNTLPNANWSNAILACQNQGKNLPNVEQLKSLYDAHAGVPEGFLVPPNAYWSKNDYSAGSAWGIYYTNGNVHNSFGKGGVWGVRCVK